MKFSIVGVFFLAILSCGKLGDKGSHGNVASTSSININKETASNVIGYNNAMVTYMKSAASKIRFAVGDFEKMTNMVASQRKEMFEAMAFIGSLPSADKKTDGIILTEGTGLPEFIKADVIKAVKGTSEAFNNAHQAYVDFNNYLENEDFKDDDWDKGASLIIALEKSITRFYANQEEAYTILRPLANDAENKLLEDHPLRESIMATKEDLTIVEKLVNLVSDEQPNRDAITMNYELLQGNLLKHKRLTPKLLKEHFKNQYYDNFYKHIDEFLQTVQISKQDGKFTSSELRDLQRKYSSIISSYNNFF
ncbi:hypothetical protein MWU59_02395 [Flavobacteriaceae bacterium F08102]|nr:hypothetical protein [Flavobacteriaceae bacterium F08102]